MTGDVPYKFIKIQSGRGGAIEGYSAEFGVRWLRGVVVLDRRGFVEQNVCPRGETLKGRHRDHHEEKCRVKTQA